MAGAREPRETRALRDVILTVRGAVSALLLLVGIAATLGAGGSLMLMGSGFLLFLVAKLSLFQRGIAISWGSTRMSVGFRFC
jgi:hypothetical protein